VIPQARCEDLFPRAAKIEWLLVEQYVEEQVIIDDYVHGRQSGEVGIIRGHLSGQFGVTTGLVDGVTKEGSQTASPSGNDQQRVAQVRDLY
jgi:hypothetical protein